MNETEKKEIKKEVTQKKKLVISDEVKAKLKEIDTAKEMEQNQKKSSLVWNFEKIRKAKEYENIAFNSDSSIRNTLRSEQLALCASINHNSKNDYQDALLSDLRELRKFNDICLFDAKKFCNKGRSASSKLSLAYDTYFKNIDNLD